MFFIILIACSLNGHICAPELLPVSYATVAECKASGDANKAQHPATVPEYMCIQK